MRGCLKSVGRVFAVGGWAPLLVFAVHVFASQVLRAYSLWPRTDIPMHFAGGVAMAYFISQCFRALPRETVRRSRIVVLEPLLVGSLTTSAAVVWEFAEFTVDAVAATSIQVSLANTMQDIALGMLGAAAVVLVRLWHTRVGRADIAEIAKDWIAGGAR